LLDSKLPPWLKRSQPVENRFARAQRRKIEKNDPTSDTPVVSKRTMAARTLRMKPGQSSSGDTDSEVEEEPSCLTRRNKIK